MSLRDQVAAAHDLTDEELVIPEWGDAKVIIRSMSLGERAELFDKSSDADGAMSIAEFYPLIVVLCTYDPETNQRAFTPDDMEMLRQKSASVLERIANTALRVSGLGPEAEKVQGKGS